MLNAADLHSVRAAAGRLDGETFVPMVRLRPHRAWYRKSMFTGVITALVTPFRGDKLDEEALRRLVDEQIAAGVDGLVPTGTTGESPTLDNEEHLRVIQRRGRGRQEARAGHRRHRLATPRTKRSRCREAAKQVGADGLLLVTPYYNRPRQEHLYRHFKAVIEAAPLPTVLYNVPGRTACDLLPETIARLAELPEVVGVKEATGSALRASQILARVGDRLALLSGDDATAFPLYALGGKRGHLGGQQRGAGADERDVGRRRGRRLGQGARLHYRLLPLGEGLFVEANPIPVKAALAMMGRIADEIRPPLYPLAAQYRDKLRAQLAELGLVVAMAVPIRIAVLGADGRMGRALTRAVLAAAPQRRADRRLRAGRAPGHRPRRRGWRGRRADRRADPQRAARRGERRRLDRLHRPQRDRERLRRRRRAGGRRW